MEIRFTKDGVDLNVCAYCNVSINEYSRTTDHAFPRETGGVLSNKNKVPSCRKCNELKGNMNPFEFIKALNSMIYLEVKDHKKNIAYLKRVRGNVNKIIENLNDK